MRCGPRVVSNSSFEYGMKEPAAERNARGAFWGVVSAVFVSAEDAAAPPTTAAAVVPIKFLRLILSHLDMSPQFRVMSVVNKAVATSNQIALR